MEAKRPLLLILTLHTIYSEPIAQNPAAELQDKHNRHDEFNQLVNRNQDCVCFEKNPGSETVAESLDPYNKGVERLVIYLYKPVSDNVTQVYVPNQDRQRLIPDVIREDGDIFIHSPQDVADIFLSNPNVIWRRSAQESQIENNVNQISSADKLMPYQSPDKNSYNNIMYYDTFEDKEPSYNYKPEIWNKIVHQHHLPLHSNHNIIKQDQQFNFDTVKMKKPTSFKKYDFFNNNQYKVKYDPIRPFKINKPRYSKSKAVVDDYTSKYDNFFKYSPLIEQVVHSSSAPSTLLYPIATSANDKYTDNDDNVSSISTNEAAITFTKWILGEIKSLDLEHLVESNTINTATLKNQIQIVLEKYGITVSSSGVLIDSKGEVLNMANLHIRPIYIGDTVEYDKLLKESNNKTALPLNMSYTKLLLITLLYPPKVLGIIPIGIVQLPNKLNTEIIAEGANREPSEPLNGKYVGSVHNGYHYLNDKIYEIITPDYSDSKLRNKLRKRNQKLRNKIFLPQIDSNMVNIQNFIEGKRTIDAFNSNYDPYFIDETSKSQEFERFMYHPDDKEIDLLIKLFHQEHASNNHENNELNVKKVNDNIINFLPTASNKKKYLAPITKNRNDALNNIISIKDFYDENEISRGGYKKSLPRESNHGSKRVTGKQWKRIKNRYKYPNIASLYKENDLPFEDPDFRIIGGAAATFSGMPISNRGRAGYIKLDK